MKEIASFTKYVKQHLYSELFEAVRAYAYQNGNDKMKEMTIKAVHAEDSLEPSLSFEVIVVALFQGKNNSYECWYQMNCQGDLGKQLDDFKVTGIRSYSGKSGIGISLSDTLIPYIRRDQLDDVAETLLKRFYPSALWENHVIDPIKLSKKLGLKLLFKRLTKEGSIFGETIFTETRVKTYDETTDEFIEETVSGGTILIDPSNYLSRNVGSLNNTIIHECVHWLLHRKAFLLERLFNPQTRFLKSDSVIVNKSSVDWIEWQAKMLTPHIQMPLASFEKKAEELRKIYHYLNEEQANLIDEMEYLIDGLASFYQVSKAAAKIRCLDLGIEEVRGIYKYVEGHYIPSYVFSRGALSPTQTFTISLNDAVTQNKENPAFQALLATGNYLYVDSHFCLNLPQYLTLNKFSKTELTRYARLHMEECCLIFDLAVKNQEKEEAYFDEVLYRDANSDIIFEAHFVNTEIVNEAILIRKRMIELQELVMSLPSSFSGTVNALIKWSELTIEKISERSLLSERTLYRMKSDEELKISLEAILQLSIGLQLPPELSSILIAHSTNQLGNSALHFLYRFLLNSRYMTTIYEWNELLEAQNFKRLGKEL